MTLDSLWEELERAPHGPGAGRLQRRIHPEAAVDLLVTVSIPDEARTLAMEADAAGPPDPQRLPEARGIHSRYALLHPGRLRLELVLADASSRELFTALAGDVAAAVARAATPSDAVGIWVNRVRRWQRLLQRVAPDGLSPEAQRGLYGELWLLREHLLDACGAERALAAWTGPDPALHDFQLPGGAVEVKTSAGKQPQALRVASERQLDDTGTGRLFLLHLSLDARQEGPGETLPQIVADLRQRMHASPAATDFDERLLDAGYLDIHAPRYRAFHYTPRASVFLRVTGAFPRILERDLRPGVGGVEYSIVVADALPWEVEADQALAELTSPDAEA